ncbi:hypothetical protein [Ruegeria sp. HKCCSP351]|uniref:hypothetical protein n=1 Tax=Ruegeria sp. HKCCSP351 TaxID=2794832 RepID=UPI001AE52DAF|nr:hypothetical protein [Ruegeria sp. HKCCSP351]
MKAYLKAVSLILAVGIWSSEAVACSIVTPPWWANEKVKTAKDCSFTGGGRFDYLSGDQAHDLGDSRVYQVLYEFTGENAVVTDCNTAEQVQVYAFDESAQTAACESPAKVVNYLKPSGPIDLSVGKGIEDLSSKIKRMGYRASRGVKFDEIGARPRDYPDFFCGCKLYYPDSPGAKL